MSEEKKKEHRAVADIQGEYSGLCAKAGHLQYQIVTLQKDLDIVNQALRDLNLEAANSQAAAAQAASETKEEPKNA